MSFSVYKTSRTALLLLLVASAVSVVFTRQASAQSVGDEVRATAIIFPSDVVEGFIGDPIGAFFGGATVVDPGIEFQFSLFQPRSIDAIIDVSEGSVQIGFVRNINSPDVVDLSVLESSTVSFNITELVGTSNPLQVELVEVNELPFSTFNGNPEDFDVRTTPTSISVDVAGGFTLREQDVISLRFRISSEPTLLGDVNRDGAVNFLDISPFIALFAIGEFQAEADTNGDGEVDFLDIVPFISLLPL